MKYVNDIFPIYLNVGRAKNDGRYHLYDITQNLRDSAHQFNDVGRPVGIALKTESLNNHLTQNVGNVNSELLDIVDTEYFVK